MKNCNQNFKDVCTRKQFFPLNERFILIEQFHCRYYQVMVFKEDGVISILNDKASKLVDHFPYFGIKISSTENDVNIHIEKSWTAIERLSSIWKYELPDKIEQGFFKVVVISILL